MVFEPCFSEIVTGAEVAGVDQLAPVNGTLVAVPLTLIWNSRAPTSSYRIVSWHGPAAGLPAPKSSGTVSVASAPLSGGAALPLSRGQRTQTVRTSRSTQTIAAVSSTRPPRGSVSGPVAGTLTGAGRTGRGTACRGGPAITSGMGPSTRRRPR